LLLLLLLLLNIVHLLVLVGYVASVDVSEHGVVGICTSDGAYWK
jgi:hypothetical protein